jgi:hypothetical protein
MNWYLTKVVFRIISDKGNHTPQFDEQLRLVKATNEQEAFAKAHAIGLKEEDSFQNSDSKMVRWSFINVAGIQHISAFEDGMELYSGIKETEDAEGYTCMIDNMAKEIASRVIKQVREEKNLTINALSWNQPINLKN